MRFTLVQVVEITHLLDRWVEVASLILGHILKYETFKLILEMWALHEVYMITGQRWFFLYTNVPLMHPT